MTVQETDGRGSFSPTGVAFGLLLAVYLALVVGFAWNPTPLAQAFAAIGVLTASVHAALFYGWKDALALFSICVVITFAVENIGSLTGFPFGHYHFEVGADLPHVGVIPVIVGPPISPGFWPGRCSARRHVQAANSNCWHGPSSPRS
jgi:uncharacterized membrane protein